MFHLTLLASMELAESNGSPEIPDKGETSDIPDLPSEGRGGYPIEI